MSRRQVIPPARQVLSASADGERPLGGVLDEIASELNLLSESRLNPDAFFERRDFLVRRLRRLAKFQGNVAGAVDHTTYHAPGAHRAERLPGRERTKTIIVRRS